MTSDEMLLLQFRRGSREAFDELFARYRGLVYGFFRRRLESRSRAEDLTQETFLAILRATERYEPRSPVRRYLFGIAYKLLSTERRKGYGWFKDTAKRVEQHYAKWAKLHPLLP